MISGHSGVLRMEMETGNKGRHRTYGGTLELPSSSYPLSEILERGFFLSLTEKYEICKNDADKNFISNIRRL